jgi:N-methylhydantoinase B
MTANGLVDMNVVWDGKIHSYRPDPDWKTRIAPSVQMHEEADDDLDPITYEVIRRRLWTINIAHGDTITRVSGSPMFQSYDFNMSIMTEDGTAVLSAPYVLELNSPAPYGVRYILEHLSDAPGIDDGDIFLCNDPWICAVHQMDVFLGCPVFVDGKLFAWVSNAGHQIDLGGTAAGGWPQNAVDAFWDPVSFTPIKFVEKGVMRSDLERAYVRQSRYPDLVALDLRAQLAGVQFAKNQLLELCGRFGANTVKAAMRGIVERARGAFAAKLRKIPDGTWTEVRHYDETLPGDRGSYRVQINLKKQGDRLMVSNEGTDPQRAGPLGQAFVSVKGSLLAALCVAMLHEQLFALGGAAEQLDFDLRPGLLNCVDFPAPVSGGISNFPLNTQMFAAAISKMLATVPELKADVMAQDPGAGWAVVSGVDDRGRPFGSALTDSATFGRGGRPTVDGLDTGGACDCPLWWHPNAETMELFYPIVFLYRRQMRDTPGAGRWRGGGALVSAITEYRAAHMELTTLTPGMAASAHSSTGLFGGYPSGTIHYHFLSDTNVREMFKEGRIPQSTDELDAANHEFLRGKSNGRVMNPGDVLEVRSAGGGGYGDPLERESERLVADIKAGWVSRQVAAEIYGVVVGDDGSVDAGATRARRAGIRDERRSWTPPRGAGVAIDAVPATGEPPRLVHESIVARDHEGHRVLACAHCDTVLCSYSDDYKRALAYYEGPATDIPLVRPPRELLDVDVIFRRFCCPSCQILMTAEVALAGEAMYPDMVLR